MSPTNIVCNKDWRRFTLPEMDGLSYYYTGLPQLVMTPLSEMVSENGNNGCGFTVSLIVSHLHTDRFAISVILKGSYTAKKCFSQLNVSSAINQTGKGNLLRALGDSVREQFFINFVDHMEYFVNEYSGALRVYREEYLEDRSRFQYYIEYMLANANDAHVFCESIATVLMRELSDIPHLKAKLVSKINVIKQGFSRLTENCRMASEEVVLMDLNSVLNNVFTSKWLEPDDITANYLQGTLVDYDETLKHARPKIYVDLVNSIGEKLLLDYLKVVITRRSPMKSDEMRRRAGEKMLKDSHMVQTYLRDGMKVREEIVAAYGALSDIARFYTEDDTSMIYLDIANLLKRFPDVQENQLVAFLTARDDMRSSQAKELVANSVHPGEQRTGVTSLNIFTKLAAVMHG